MSILNCRKFPYDVVGRKAQGSSRLDRGGLLKGLQNWIMYMFWSVHFICEHNAKILK